MVKYYVQLDPLIVIRLGRYLGGEEYQVEKILRYDNSHYEVTDDHKSWKWRSMFGRGELFNNIISISGEIRENVHEFEDDDTCLLYSEVYDG